MLSLIAFTGVNIDRAFPGLGVDAATRRRALSLSALVKMTATARERAVDAIVVVGGLLDDRSVGAESASAAFQVLGSAGVPVLIAPGVADPVGASGAYAGMTASLDITIWTSTEFESGPQLGGVGIVGRARSGVWDSRPELPNSFGDSPIVVVGEGLDADRFDVPGVLHLVTTGAHERADRNSTVLRPVNGELGEPFGRAALIRIDDALAVSTEWVDLLPGHPSCEPVDVSAASTTDELAAQIEEAVTALAPWSVLRLVGAVQPGVVLPSTNGEGPRRDDILINDSSLEFAFESPPAADHSAVAEFARSIVTAPADDRTRHQAMALGMRALRESARERAAL